MWQADKIYYHGYSGYTKAYQGSEMVWDSFLVNTFKLTAKASSTVGLEKISTGQTLEYSTDGGSTWLSMTTATTINLTSGQSVYVRGNLSSDNTDSNNTQFKMTGNIKASGIINYLWNKNNPDAELKAYCGAALFSGCTSLTDVSELRFPSTTLSARCYRNMFRNTRITTAPALPATTLATYCYSSMFNSCTSLTSAPELPATTLATYCYYYMFENCTSLTQAPELPAPTLMNYCYNNMFKNCSSLNYIKCLATDRSASNCTVNWVSGVASTGTFVKDVSMTGWPTGNNGIPTGWTELLDYFKLTAKENNSSIRLSQLSTGQTIEYSYDGSNWYNMTTGGGMQIFSGFTVYFRGVLSSNNTTSNYTQFKLSGNLKASGNINYLWNKDNPDSQLKQFCGYNLFASCTALTDVSELTLPATALTSECYRNMFRDSGIYAAPKLPATTLTSNCYRSMFNNCANLTTAPELPATTLATYCYFYMFENCTSLTIAPELPATTLAYRCYEGMFHGCTSLNYIKCLATNISANNYTSIWVENTASNGTFVKSTSATDWTTGNDGIPSGWYIINV